MLTHYAENLPAHLTTEHTLYAYWQWLNCSIICNISQNGPAVSVSPAIQQALSARCSACWLHVRVITSSAIYGPFPASWQGLIPLLLLYLQYFRRITERRLPEHRYAQTDSY